MEQQQTKDRKDIPLVEAVRGTPLDVSWGQGNALVHMVEACVWLNQSHPKWDEWVAAVTSAAPKLGEGWKPAAEFVRAVDLHKHGDIKAHKALEATAAGNDANEHEIKATAFLILARRALAGGTYAELARTTKADRIAAAEFISRMPKTGARHIVAIAKRLLQQGA